MDKDFDYENLVIGAGTGGLSAGCIFKNQKREYVIIDKKEEIGLPVRSTGAVSLEWVNRIGMPTSDEIVASKIYNMSFRTDKGKRIDLNYDRPVGMVYDFTKYEKYLSTRFAGSLDIKLKTAVNEVKGNQIYTNEGIITAKNIIMAAGPQSNLGSKLSKSQALVAYEETRSLDERKDFQMILWFSDLAPGGYFWDFADSRNTRKVGVCYYPHSGEAPKSVLKKFTDKYPELSGEVVHTMAHQIPLTGPSDQVVKGNQLWVGDMVNAVLNTTAGGLQGAFWSGKEAALACSADNPGQYQKVWDAQIKPWLLKHNALHKKIHSKGVNSVGKYISIAKIMPKSVRLRVFGGL